MICEIYSKNQITYPFCIYFLNAESPTHIFIFLGTLYFICQILSVPIRQAVPVHKELVG